MKSLRQRNSGINNNIEKKKSIKEHRRILRIERMNRAKDSEGTPPSVDSKVVQNFTRLIAKKIENPEIEIKERELMVEGIIPKPLSSVLFVGTTGSGKSNTILNWLGNEEFYKDFFDEIYLFSTTAKIDPLWKNSGIKKENIITENMESEITNIMKNLRQNKEEKGAINSDKVLIIFEDATGNNKLLKSKSMIECFTAGRHFKATVWLVVHQYKKCVPAVRLNASQLVIFPQNNTQLAQLYEDYAGSGCSKKAFNEMVKYAWGETEEDKRPFLFINNKKNIEMVILVKVYTNI